MNRSGALRIRSSLYRQRPWVTDGTWVAHESLQLFTAVAGQLPSNGWWSLGDEHGFGVRPIEGGGAPDLAAFVTEVHSKSMPCVIPPIEYCRADNTEAAMEIAGQQLIEVLDSEGTGWVFDHDFIEAAQIGRSDISWRIAPHSKGAVLVGADRKNRPRFVVMSMVLDPDGAR